MNDGVMSPVLKVKLSRFFERFTEDSKSKVQLYSGLGIVYTLFAIAWFFLNSIGLGIAWGLLAIATWLLTYMNWRKTR